MQPGSLFFSLAVSVCLLASPSPGTAQGKFKGKGPFDPFVPAIPGPMDPAFLERDEGRYPKVPFNSKDVESLFREQLKGAKNLDFARELLEQAKKSSGLPPEWLNNPKLVQMLLKSLDINKPFNDMSDKEKADLTSKLEKMHKDFTAKKDLPWDGQPPELGGPAKDMIPTPPKAEAKNDNWISQERLKEMFQEWMEGADGSEFGRWLRESDAWKNTIEELKGHLQDIDAPDFKFDLSFLKDGLNNIQSLPTPRLPRFNMPSIGLGRMAGPVSGPGGVTAGTMQTLVWLVVAVLILGAGVYAYRQWQPRAMLQAQTGLGPWPVDPGSVSTRDQLRRAFEYLALLTLGPSAETWNHRHIAGIWAQEAGQKRDAALGLASLYEQARYTPGPEQLSPAEADLARGSLLALTPGPKAELQA